MPELRHPELRAEGGLSGRRNQQYLGRESSSDRAVQLRKGEDNTFRVKVHIPMQNRMVTEYSGRLFSSSESEIGIHLTADTEWQVYKQFTF